MTAPLYPHYDFDATIRIYTPEEGGRRTLPHNGILWDFAYAEEAPLELYSIHPDFYAEDGHSLPTRQPLPVDIELPAHMFIRNGKIRQEIHRLRMAPGTRFYCHEGPRRVAEGVITRITGLFEAWT